MPESPDSDIQSVEGLLKIINKKWTILTVVAIGSMKRVRFNDLRRELVDISPKTLIQTLRDLDSIGVVKSEQFMEIPPKVEYFLTERGEEFRMSLMPIVKWLVRYTRASKQGVLSTAVSLLED